MSPRRNWDSPNPSLASECAPPHGTKEGGTLACGGGGGGYQFGRLEKKPSTLSTQWAALSSYQTLANVTEEI
jgi:hypothetical protein